eukprot:CAMPEP_0176344350 /NCGR_PEP_ID=MMETSP0126-20121128/4640_1 /TAXON_ID=141414 ORGANISM="Strombidinopsis acuminatum, Strain SPMC142" /NCGR_SAMPLE_ID=MMETSP0126 /ASSEMBLY_ACC=CAM_ASM_000229 /LENGTH=60 /DNA_ID=CAMNT_0017690779 /DNA_START=232 /DNA_END=414 /DNA_ORIENTATION=-
MPLLRTVVVEEQGDAVKVGMAGFLFEFDPFLFEGVRKFASWKVALCPYCLKGDDYRSRPV